MKASEMGHLCRDTDPGSTGSPNPADDPESVPLWRPSWRRRESILPEATTLEKFTHLRLSRGFIEGITQQNFTCHRLRGCFRFDPDEELICRCSGIRCWIQFVCLWHSNSIYTIIRESSIMEKQPLFYLIYAEISIKETKMSLIKVIPGVVYEKNPCLDQI